MKGNLQSIVAQSITGMLNCHKREQSIKLGLNLVAIKVVQSQVSDFVEIFPPQHV